MNVADEVDEVNGVDENEINENENIVDVRDYIGKNLHQHWNLKQNLEIHSSSTKNRSKFSSKNLLSELLSKTYQNDETANSIIAAKRAGL